MKKTLDFTRFSRGTSKLHRCEINMPWFISFSFRSQMYTVLFITKKQGQIIPIVINYMQRKKRGKGLPEVLGNKGT